MRTELFWIPGTWTGRLAIMPRPRGGDWLEDEIRSWRRSGIDLVVSLLTPDEIADLNLIDEQKLCEANEIKFLSFPIDDRDVPSSQEAVEELAMYLVEQLKEGKNVAIHCRQGIGRAALIAICLLVLKGIEIEPAIREVTAARGLSVPETTEQQRWLSEFARSLTAPIAN